MSGQSFLLVFFSKTVLVRLGAIQVVQDIEP